MKKKKRPQLRYTRIRRATIVLMILMLGFLSINLLNNPHLHFRLQNIISPVTGEFVFTSNSGNNNRYYNIFHADFNTAFNSIAITQLTPDARDSLAPTYSPDGKYIAYFSGSDTYLINADGTNLHKLTAGIYPRWLDNDTLIIQRLIGSQITIQLTYCPVYAPFLFDLTTGQVTNLFGVYDESHQKNSTELYQFPGHQKLVSCRNPYASSFGYYTITDDNRLIPFLDADSPLQISAYNRQISPANNHEKLAKVSISPWRDVINVISGIYVSQNTGEDWQLVKQVHAQYVAWSPDDNFLIYSANHPDGTDVIAITSIDGSYTYPLLGNDGFNYATPDWKPNT